MNVTVRWPHPFGHIVSFGHIVPHPFGHIVSSLGHRDDCHIQDKNLRLMVYGQGQESVLEIYGCFWSVAIHWVAHL